MSAEKLSSSPDLDEQAERGARLRARAREMAGRPGTHADLANAYNLYAQGGVLRADIEFALRPVGISYRDFENFIVRAEQDAA